MSKPRIKMIRCQGQIWWKCEDHGGAIILRQGFGLTPTEAYDDWFEDQIPF